MRVLQINSVCGIRSTGRICTDLADVLHSNGDLCRIGYGREGVPETYRDIAMPVGTRGDVLSHAAGSRLLDNTGAYSKAATEHFLERVDAYEPDLIHLHNIHGYYINLERLFDHIKQKKLPVVWTLHDCWAFTGHCSHFAAVGCEKWKTACGDCPQRGAYPASLFFDNSRRNFERKKLCFGGVDNLQLVTPSHWLRSCVEQSFLRQYPVRTIPNGIDLNVFQPVPSELADRHGIAGKKIVLGVASAWSDRKGLDKFFALADLLDKKFQVVLVGLTEAQCRRLPEHVIGIRRTNSVRELAQLYTAAYVHVSMSREETMGLTILEANACGTPVIVPNATALPEIVTEKSGVVVDVCTPEAVAHTLQTRDFCREFSGEACIAHAKEYEKKKMYDKYLELYRSMLK